VFLGAGLYLKHKRRSKTRRSDYADNPQGSKALLCDLSHFTSLSEYDITDKRTYIGRQPREVTERSCIIIIGDSSVGRNHAFIDCRDKQYWIRDMDTVNGTYINGERISGNRQLHHGDKIRFARFEFALTLPSVEEISDPLGHTYTATDTIPDDERTVFRSRQ
jgi:predicted component of type VI protein secretion system